MRVGYALNDLGHAGGIDCKRQQGRGRAKKNKMSSGKKAKGGKEVIFFIN